MEAEELHPVRDARGVLQFSEEEVERLARSRSTSDPRRHGIALSRPAWADDHEAALHEQARELEELRTLTVQLGAARNSERTRWAAELHRVREEAQTAAQLAEGREQAERAERGERERMDVEAGERRRLLRLETIQFLDGLSRRQLASIDPVDLEDMLELVDDSD